MRRRMQLILYGTGILTAASLVVAALIWLGLRIARGKRPGYWRRVLWVHTLLVPFYAVVVIPAALGFVATRFVGTRNDEAGYQGPRLAANGSFQRQSRVTLRAEAHGESAVDPETARAARQRAVQLVSEDGTLLRAFFLPAARPVPRCTAILVHGLFRGALELEPVAEMFHELGADTVMLELRNHGGSGRAVPTFGRDESRDVLAAVDWVRSRSPTPPPLVLFGVSLGTAAVALAADEVRGLGGLVLDAPIDDALVVAHRMLTQGPRPGRRGFVLLQPFRSACLTAIEFWGGFSFDEVRPVVELAGLDPGTPVLLIGGALDRRVPPDAVRAMFEQLPTRADRKIEWIVPGADHGKAWEADAAGYRAHLEQLLDLVAG